MKFLLFYVDSEEKNQDIVSLLKQTKVNYDLYNCTKEPIPACIHKSPSLLVLPDKLIEGKSNIVHFLQKFPC